jgi:hypothetical protein
MIMWLFVALAGVIAALCGFRALSRQYRCGELRGRYLLASAVGFVSFTAYVLSITLWPAAVSGAITLLLLTPALIAIVVVVREHQSPHHK